MASSKSENKDLGFVQRYGKFYPVTRIGREYAYYRVDGNELRVSVSSGSVDGGVLYFSREAKEKAEEEAKKADALREYLKRIRDTVVVLSKACERYNAEIWSVLDARYTVRSKEFVDVIQTHKPKIAEAYAALEKLHAGEE